MDPSGEKNEGLLQPPGGHQMMGSGSSGTDMRQMMDKQAGPPGMPDISDDLMMKVRQQQQLLDMEKQREAQQKLMEQQQLALLGAQRNEQQQRMMPQSQGQSLGPPGMPSAPSVRSSGVSMVSTTLQPPAVGSQSGQGMAPPGMANQSRQGMAPPGVVIPQAQPAQMMAGGPSHPPQGGPPASHGGPQMSHGGPSMGHGGPRMQSGPPPTPRMMQMGQMQQRGERPPQIGERPPMQMGERPPMQMGERPPMQMGERPPMQMGERPPMQMGDRPDRPSMPMGDRPDRQSMQMGDRPQMQMGDRPQMQMGDRPQMQMGDRPQMPMGDRPQMPMGDRPQMQMGDRPQMQMGDRPQMQMGDRPQMQMGDRPQMQMGDRPQMQMGDRPQMQMGDRPQMPMGDRPQIPMGDRPQMQMGDRPQMQMGDRPQMPMGDRPQMQMGDRPQMQMGDRPPMQMGDRPQMQMGDRPQMQMGDRPPMQMGDRPPMGERPQMQMGDRPPMQMGERPPMQMGDRPQMQMGDRPPMQMGDRPPMGERPQMQMGDRPPMQMGERPPMQMGERPPMPMSQSGPLHRLPPPLMSQNLRPSMQSKDNMGPSSQAEQGPHGPPPDGGAARITRPPYNGPNIPQASREQKPILHSQSGPPSQGSKEMRLPQALEKMLEFKSQRESEVGIELDNIDGKEDDKENDDGDEDNMINEKDNVNEEDEDEDDEGNEIVSKDQSKESKNKRKKKKKKKARRNRFEQQKKTSRKKDKKKAPEVQVEYIQEQAELDPADPNYHTFAQIFELFKISEPEKPKDIKVEDSMEIKPKEEVPLKVRGLLGEDDDDDDDDELMKNDEDGPKISKKKLKKLTRLTVAQLKQLVTRPDVVEMHDVTARDPRLLVHLKASRNSVPVPRHWCYKRKYLQGKRGIEKTPFELPDFIKATGIEEMRAALQEKEDQKTLKSKMREKVRPKMGKIDIDYQKLHDAFFRFQTKPKMTVHGDLYYEAKEFETKLREKKPGNLSDDLKMALGIPIGVNSEKVPPPWLIAMQRYGPPPSYPNLKIPGLNAPIPEGCMFGYHAGGWGKPPVDEHGKPLYGDVFGTQSAEFKTEEEEEEIDNTQWGELESESESEEESEEEEDEDKDETGLITPAEGLMTPGGITSVPLGMETPDQIELRKKRIEDAMDQGGDTPALYQVLPEKKAAPVGGAMMGSTHVYDISGVPAPKKPGEKVSTEAVEVSLNPEELDLDTAAMQAKYEQTMKEQQSQLEKEDLSDMVAAHAAKQRKRKKAQQDTGKGAKKYKDFKF